MVVAPLESDHVEEICAILADTASGLTGSQIGSYLAQIGVDDPHPGMTKRYRLLEALLRRQVQDANGSCVVAFIEAVMSPVHYARNRPLFESRQRDLNTVLAFAGFVLGDDGKLQARESVSTLEAAQVRADRLRSLLVARGVHADVLHFCQAELLQDNYFHAVFEATKSVADKLRRISGLTKDGSRLVDAALGGQTSTLAINSLNTETHWFEQAGFVNLVKGMFGVFRNTAAHAPKVSWPIDEQDALDLLSLASYIHRRLDTVTPNTAQKRRPAQRQP